MSGGSEGKIKYANPPGYWDNTQSAQAALQAEQDRLNQFNQWAQNFISQAQGLLGYSPQLNSTYAQDMFNKLVAGQDINESDYKIKKTGAAPPVPVAKNDDAAQAAQNATIA